MQCEGGLGAHQGMERAPNEVGQPERTRTPAGPSAPAHSDREELSPRSTGTRGASPTRGSRSPRPRADGATSGCQPRDGTGSPESSRGLGVPPLPGAAARGRRKKKKRGGTRLPLHGKAGWFLPPGVHPALAAREEQGHTGSLDEQLEQHDRRLQHARSAAFLPAFLPACLPRRHGTARHGAARHGRLPHAGPWPCSSSRPPGREQCGGWREARAGSAGGDPALLPPRAWGCSPGASPPRRAPALAPGSVTPPRPPRDGVPEAGCTEREQGGKRASGERPPFSPFPHLAKLRPGLSPPLLLLLAALGCLPSPARGPTKEEHAADKGAKVERGRWGRAQRGARGAAGPPPARRASPHGPRPEAKVAGR